MFDNYKTAYQSLFGLTLILTILMSACRYRLDHLGSNQALREEEQLIDDSGSDLLPVEAIWVEVLSPAQPLESKAGIREVISQAKRSGLSEIYLQVYKAGKAWFNSSFADRSPYLRAKQAGYDPLAYALELAAQQDIKIHAWLNVFNLADNRKSPIIDSPDSDVLLVDNLGVSIGDYDKTGRSKDARSKYFSLGSPGLWLDPGNTLVELNNTALVSELLKTYPGLAGVHLDYFRYPYLLPIRPSSAVRFGYDFGYSQSTRLKFAKDLNIERAFKSVSAKGLQPINSKVSLAWDNWRRERLTKFLAKVRKMLKTEQELSVATIAWPDRAYFSSYQNWRLWLKKDLVDQICLMAYTSDFEQFEYLVQQASAFKGKRSKLYAGIGAWILSPKQIKE